VSSKLILLLLLLPHQRALVLFEPNQRPEHDLLNGICLQSQGLIPSKEKSRLRHTLYRSLRKVTNPYEVISIYIRSLIAGTHQVTVGPAKPDG
jgi:hypothetical protein